MREYMTREVEGVYEGGCGSMREHERVFERGCRGQILSPLVPDWGDIVDSGIGLSYRRHAAYVAWRASTTTLCQSQLLYIPPVRDLEFGYKA
jgi:hypothetical protein